MVVRRFGQGWSWTFCTFNDYQMTAYYFITTRETKNTYSVTARLEALFPIRKKECAAHNMCNIKKTFDYGQNSTRIESGWVQVQWHIFFLFNNLFNPHDTRYNLNCYLSISDPQEIYIVWIYLYRGYKNKGSPPHTLNGAYKWSCK